jgi:hypothetical protein
MEYPVERSLCGDAWEDIIVAAEVNKLSECHESFVVSIDFVDVND